MSVNSPKSNEDKSATRRQPETESDVLDETEPPVREPEGTVASVLGIVEVQRQGAEPEVTEADEGAADSSPPPWRELLRNNSLPVVVGGLSGAMAAIAAVFVLTALRPPMDPRVEPLAQNLGAFNQRLQVQESGLRAVEVDLVGTLGRQAEVSAEVAKQNAVIETVRGQVATVNERIRAESGPGSSVFGVAVVQLADSIALGRPFEAEWVNLFALTANEAKLRAELQRLLPFARAGVDTIAGLRRRLRAGASRVKLVIARPNDILWVATDYLQTQLGLSLGATPAEKAAEAALTEADRRLASGDPEGAIELVADLGLPFADGFGDWLEAARRRVLADTVATGLTTVARQEISARARRIASAQGVGSGGSRDAPLRMTR
jgi:hypothetical protein